MNASNWWLCENSGTRGGEATTRKLPANTAGNWATSADSSSQTTFQLTDTLPDLLFSPEFLRLMFYFGEIAEFQSANAEVEENVGAVLRQLFSVRVQVLPPAAAADKSCLFSTGEGEFSCRPVTCSPYRCLHNSAITGITSHRSMWQNLVNPNISLREEITLLQSMLVKEGMTRDICCLVGVKGFYGSFFFLPPPLSPISEDLKPKQCCVFVLPDMLYLVLSLSQAAANTCARFPQITHSSMHHHRHPSSPH